MARADLLIELVRGGAEGDQQRFRKALEALITEERAKQHHILADRLAAYLRADSVSPRSNGGPNRGSRNNNELFHEITPSRRFRDLILPEVVRRVAEEVIEEHNRRDLLYAHNLEPRHRLLLVGPPGNGKTSFAEALAHELAMPLLSVRYESVIASYLGETAVRLSRLFEHVRTRQCVLFFDEFDVVGKERGDVHETGEIKRVVSSLLLQIDDLPSHVVVVTATNHPELLDRAVWRRFQIRIVLPSPEPNAAEEWFRRLEHEFEGGLGFSPATLAKRLNGLSFAELEQFGLDISRRYVLDLPNAEVKKIVAQRLEEWQLRASPTEL